MDKVQFDKVLKPLINIYDEIEIDIIKNILERLRTYDNVTGSLEWYLEKLAELGTFERENLEVFKKNKKKIEEELTKIITNSPVQNNNLETLENYYEKGLINVNPADLYKSEAFNKIIDNALKETNDIIDLIQTKAIEGANEGYKEILNKAYIETASGVYTYQESIRRALKDFSDKGITTVHYSSGKKLGIEAVVRRDVLTQVNHLVGDIELENARKLETNLVYVDQHLGARVRTPYMKNDYEAHAEWQGKVYMIEGSDDKYDNFFKKTGYGEMLGLKGINCYHDFRAFFEWEKIPEPVDKAENKKRYELLQKQRSYERKIRRLKREKEIAKDYYSDEEKKALNEKYNATSKEFNSFINDNELRRDYSREYIKSSHNNIGTLGNSKSNKKSNLKVEFIEKIPLNEVPEKIIEYENNIRGKDIEYSYVIRGNGNVYLYTGSEKNVNIETDDLSVVTHNHPIDYDIYRSFGEDDFDFIKNHNVKELRLTTPDYDYSLKKIKEFDNISYNEIYLEAMKKYNYEDDFEVQHEAMKILAERGFVEYERRVRKS